MKLKPLSKRLFLAACCVLPLIFVSSCDSGTRAGSAELVDVSGIGSTNTSAAKSPDLPSYKLPDVFLMTNRQPAEIRFFYDSAPDPLPVWFEPRLDNASRADISLDYAERAKSVIVKARTPGDYNVNVTVTNGIESKQDSFTIRVVDIDFVVPEVSIRPFFRPVQDWELSAYHSPIMHNTETELYVAYLWTVNGQPYTESNMEILYNHPFTRGDVVTVQLLVTDQDEVWESPVSAPVTIANSLPTFDAAFEPRSIRGDQALSVDISNVRDSEDDAIGFSYQWLLNGEVLQGQTNETLPAGVAVYKDELSVRVIANDGYDDAVETISLTVADTPSSLDHDGSQIEFRYGLSNLHEVKFIDPDGTPVQTTLHAAPDGVSYNNGIIQWTPRPTMLFSSEHFTVTLRSSDGQTGEVGIAVTNPDQQPLTARSAFAIPKLENNVYVLDFDGDGTTEFLSTDSDDRIFTGEVRNNELIQDWLYPYSGKSEGSIRFIKPTGTGSLFVARENAVQLIDSVSSAPRTVFESNTEILAAAWDDVNGDGVSEAILLLARDQLQIIDSTDWSVRYVVDLQQHDRWAHSVITGDVDNDAALEIITGSGDVIDGANGIVEWQSNFRFGEGLATGDVDGDGMAEIVAADRYSNLAVYDARTRTMRNYSHDETDLCSVLVANVDNDPQQEIITGGCQAETIAIREVSELSIAVKHQYPQGISVSRPRNIAMGDLTSDGQPNLIWTTGIGTTATNGFVVARLPDGDVDSEKVIARNVDPSELGELTLLGVSTSLGNTAAVYSSASSEGLRTGQRLIRLESTGIKAISDPAGSDTVKQSGFLADSDRDGIDEAFLAGGYPYNFNNYSIDTFTAQNVFLGDLSQSSIARGYLSDGSVVALVASNDRFNNVARVYEATTGDAHYISSRFPDQIEFMFTYQYETSTHFIFATESIIRRFEIVDRQFVNTTGIAAACDYLKPLQYDDGSSLICIKNHYDTSDITIYNINLQEVAKHRLESTVTALSIMPAVGSDKLLLGLQSCSISYSDCSNDSRLGIFETAAKALTWQSHSLIGEITGIDAVTDPLTGKQVFAVGSGRAMYLSR